MDGVAPGEEALHQMVEELNVFRNAYDNLTNFNIERAKECVVASEMCGTLHKKIEETGDKSDNALLKMAVLRSAAKELKVNARFALNSAKYII